DEQDHEEDHEQLGRPDVHARERMHTSAGCRSGAGVGGSMAAVRDAVVVTFATILGALVGSFLNVVLYRVPRHESIVYPGSHCPSCGTPLRWYELVPVLSWVALRGRCRTCHTHISARYPIVEAGCGLATGVVALLIVR